MLGLATPAAQNFWAEHAAALIAGRCALPEFGMIDRFIREQILLSEELAANDIHFSDNEATAELKLSANARAAQSARGTELTRIASAKASLVKRSQKAFDALQGCLSASELEILRHQYASAYNKAVAASGASYWTS